MTDPLETSGYLQHQNASPRVVDLLYQKGYIKASAKEFALDQISPKPAWPYQCSVFMQMVGISAILTGIILAILYQWPKLTTQYQLMLLMLGILCGIFGAFVFNQIKWFSQTMLCLSLGITVFLSFKLLLLHRPVYIIAAFGVLGLLIIFSIIYRMLPRAWFRG